MKRSQIEESTNKDIIYPLVIKVNTAGLSPMFRTIISLVDGIFTGEQQNVI